MEKQLVVGRTYAVTTSTTCNVTDANGTLITSASSGQQVVFVAPTTTVSFSDDSASVVEVFNLALAKTRLFEQLGGGRLPSGYIPALFLYCRRRQYINSGFYADQNSAFAAEVSTNDYASALLCGFRSAWASSDSFGFSIVDALKCYALFDGNTVSVENAEMIAKLANKTKITLDASGCRFDGELFQAFSSVEEFTGVHPVYVGALKSGDTVDSRGWHGKIYNFKLSRNGILERSFFPVIAPSGEPCFFDKITKKPFYNEGEAAFIVGMTSTQARKLGNLPASATNKNLTISLPSAIVSGETVTDSAVAAALANARANGWTITIQTYSE